MYEFRFEITNIELIKDLIQKNYASSKSPKARDNDHRIFHEGFDPAPQRPEVGDIWYNIHTRKYMGWNGMCWLELA